MIQKAFLIFCDNEHGTGDVCFPDLDKMDPWETKQAFCEGASSINARLVRAEAKKAGWGRVNGGDYCPACMESGI